MEDIKSLENKCLSDQEIRHILGSNIKIITYPQLSKYSNIDQCFGAGNFFILFFEEDKEHWQVSGHWEFVQLLNNGNILFFDSYGLKVDECKKWLPQYTLMKLKEYPNYLTDLLSKSNRTVFYNPYKYQSFSSGVNTCGDFVCMRALCRNMNGLQFKNYLDELKRKYNVKTYDEAVTEFIYQNYGI